MGCNVSILQYRRLSISGISERSVIPDVDSPVEVALRLAREQEALRQKILLLGAGESGKSTVIKQIKMIWKIGGGMSAKEKNEYITAIRTNSLEAVKVLIVAAKTLGMPLGAGPGTSARRTGSSLIQGSRKDDQGAEIEEEEKEEEGEEVGSTARDPIADYAREVAAAHTLTPELAHKITCLWNHHTIQAVFARRDEYWNMDNTPYYLEEVFTTHACASCPPLPLATIYSSPATSYNSDPSSPHRRHHHHHRRHHHHHHHHNHHYHRHYHHYHHHHQGGAPSRLRI